MSGHHSFELINGSTPDGCRMCRDFMSLIKLPEYSACGSCGRSLGIHMLRHPHHIVKGPNLDHCEGFLFIPPVNDIKIRMSKIHLMGMIDQ